MAEEDLDTGRLAGAGKADTQDHANSREARTGGRRAMGRSVPRQLWPSPH